MAPATLERPAPTLSKADQKKVGRYGFHEPRDFHNDEAENFALISIYQLVPNKSGTALKTAAIGKVRFRRKNTELAVKRARIIVKQLNAGEAIGDLFPDCGVVSVS